MGDTAAVLVSMTFIITLCVKGACECQCQCALPVIPGCDRHPPDSTGTASGN